MKEQSIILPADEIGFRVRHLTTVITFIKSLAVDRAWEIVIKPFRATRSAAQNRALWGLAYKILSDETGNEPEDLHEYFLGEFTGWEIRNVMGRKKQVPKKRSSKMDTAEFAKFFDFIQRRSAETVGVYIPDPDPNWWTKDEREQLPWRRAA